MYNNFSAQHQPTSTSAILPPEDTEHGSVTSMFKKPVRLKLQIEKAQQLAALTFWPQECTGTGGDVELSQHQATNTHVNSTMVSQGSKPKTKAGLAGARCNTSVMLPPENCSVQT